MSRIETIATRGIYTDLLRYMRNQGHNIFLVSPRERALGIPTSYIDTDGIHILGVKTLNLQKTSVIEKGVGQLLVEYQYRSAIRKYLKDVRFDLILYSTPPITFPAVIRYAKHQTPSARTFLLLKDIFPQNAIDIGMMRKSGLKGILYHYFRRKEKTLYALSDLIGCMSPANVDYVLKHNPDITARKVVIAPNSIELKSEGIIDRRVTRLQYGLPLDRPIFIYGGNLGKPQGISFLIKCLESNSNRIDSHIVIIGSGTEYSILREWYQKSKPSSVTVMEGLPKDEYDKLVSSCDVGLIFLDHRFTIPNYPSRLLSYLENKMPVLCATDPNTDIGRIAEENGYGFWCESNSIAAFTSQYDRMLHSDLHEMGNRGYEYLKKNYLVENTYNAIMSRLS